MRRKSIGLAAAVVALMLGSGALFEGGGMEAAGQQEMTENPFLTESALPYQLPPFDRIEDAHYAPAFERGMTEQLEEIEAIASQSDPPTFDNTIVPLERSGRTLDRVARTFFSLASAHTNDAINEIRNEMAPRLAAHTDAMLLNADLFARGAGAPRPARIAGPRRRVAAAHRAVLRRLRAGGGAAFRVAEGADAGDQRRARGVGEPLHAERAGRGQCLRSGR